MYLHARGVVCGPVNLLMFCSTTVIDLCHTTESLPQKMDLVHYIVIYVYIYICVCVCVCVYVYVTEQKHFSEHYSHGHLSHNTILTMDQTP